MSGAMDNRYYVAIIGAGPAGLFAARELASRGIHAVLFNRDIKPGGLAEYGIYHTKTMMKEGLRKQFRQILALDDVEYYGNVLIGEQNSPAVMSIDDLRSLGFDALLVTVGAQSTKRLGLPGETLTGVYHAKDVVYHYNLLPPFSESTFQIGKRVAIIGVGNVMIDIARWLIEDKHVDEVTAVARRGPAEVKFDRKELETVIGFMDMDALDAEINRVLPTMQAIGQTPDELKKMIEEVSKKVAPVDSHSKFKLRFLTSPTAVIGDENERMTGLEVEENKLVLGDDKESRAVGTGLRSVMDFDTVIFAIGDVVDSALGLPVQRGEYAKNPQPRYPLEGVSFEAYDPQKSAPIEDVFLAGWARRPSTGLVGIARKDGVNAAQVIAEYLNTLAPSGEPVPERVHERLSQVTRPVVDKAALLRLEALERERAQELNVETYKFASNHEMLEVLGLIKSPNT